jgi:hypothetical protein
MMKTYAYEWFGIKFNSFAVLSRKKLADAKFYEKFYCEFYKRFHSYSELPDFYKRSKDEVAHFLYKIVKNKRKILSIGSGNCIIEQTLSNLLLENNNRVAELGHNITAIEPSIPISSIWLKAKNVKLLQGFFPDVLEPKENFDVTYASNIDYTFNDELYFKFLKSVVDFGIKDFILTDIITPPYLGTSVFIKNVIKDLLSDFNLYETRQFWGYMRTINEHKVFLKKAGFSHIEFGDFSYGSKYLRARID